MKLSNLQKGDEVVVVWHGSLKIAKISKINSKTIVVDGDKYLMDGGRGQDCTGPWPYIEPVTPDWREVIRLVALARNTFNYISVSWQWWRDVGKKLDDLQNITNDLLSIVYDIRQAAGVGEKAMLGDLAECVANLKKGHDRYEKVRKMNPQQFAELCRQNIQDGKLFDDLVDGL